MMNELFVKHRSLYFTYEGPLPLSITDPGPCANIIRNFKVNFVDINENIKFIRQDVSQHIVVPETYDREYVEGEKEYISDMVKILKYLDELRQQKKQFLTSRAICDDPKAVYRVCRIEFHDLNALLADTSANPWINYNTQIMSKISNSAEKCNKIIEILRSLIWQFGVNFHDKSSKYLNIIYKNIVPLSSSQLFQNDNLLSDTKSLIETGLNYTNNYINRTVHDNFDIIDHFVACDKPKLVRNFKTKMQSEIDLMTLNRMRLDYHNGDMSSTLKLTKHLSKPMKDLYYHSLSSYYHQEPKNDHQLMILDQHIREERQAHRWIHKRYYEDILWYEISAQLRERNDTDDDTEGWSIQKEG